MRDVTISLESLTAYSTSKPTIPYAEGKQKGETQDDYERRIWPEKAHVNVDGFVIIPGVSFKLALDEAAKLANEKIIGKGNQTYTAQFATGVVAMDDVVLDVKAADLKSIRIYAHSNGTRGPGKRVNRWFPYIPYWRGALRMRVFNDAIPQDVFERFFENAGLLAGIGRGRPITGSPAGNGRFRATEFVWT